MTLNEILANYGYSGTATGLVLLTLLQLSPIKINPWTAICTAIGKVLNANVIDELCKQEAKICRYRIIRFDDEIRHSQSRRHTEEHFNQIIEDVDYYEDYCKKHPEFPNGKAVVAVKNIKDEYLRCRHENDFLV